MNAADWRICVIDTMGISTNTTPTTSLPSKLLYDRKEAAWLLSLCPRTIDNLIASKQLKCIRIGNRVRLTVDELQKFIKRSHPTGAELN